MRSSKRIVSNKEQGESATPPCHACSCGVRRQREQGKTRSCVASSAIGKRDDLERWTFHCPRLVLEPGENETNRSGLGRQQLDPARGRAVTNIKDQIHNNGLQIATTATGGTHFATWRDRSIQAAIDEIGGELHSQYLLMHTPTATKLVRFPDQNLLRRLCRLPRPRRGMGSGIVTFDSIHLCSPPLDSVLPSYQSGDDYEEEIGSVGSGGVHRVGDWLQANDAYGPNHIKCTRSGDRRTPHRLTCTCILWSCSASLTRL